ncbi:MAG: hypothetical protein RSC60_06670 [Christensenellaceae bacterium]
MQTLAIDLKRSLTSWGFIVGIIGMALVAFFGAFEQILPILQGNMQQVMSGFSIQILLSSLSSDVVLMTMPILCAMPYTAAFLDEYKCGYLKEYLPRTTKKAYVQSKVLATAISGGLVLFVGIIITYVVFALIFTPIEVVPQIPKEMVNMPQTLDVSSQITFTTFISKAFVFFLCGMLWSLVGAFFASFTLNKYMAYASPFIIYYVLIILCERYFTEIYMLNPKEWIVQANFWAGGVFGVMLFLAELIIIVGIGYSLSMKGRIKYV